MLFPEKHPTREGISELEFHAPNLTPGVSDRHPSHFRWEQPSLSATWANCEGPNERLLLVEGLLFFMQV